MELYNFQVKALTDLVFGKHICIMATGSGKSAVMMRWLKARNPSKVLIVTTPSKRNSCFTKGQLVSTPNGDVPIETLRVDDEVYSFDEKQKEVVVKKITGTLKRDVEDNLYRLSFGRGCDIIATEDHPFYNGAGYTQIKDLRKGDSIYGIRSTQSRSSKETQESNGEVLQKQPEPEMYDMSNANRTDKGTKRQMVGKGGSILLERMLEKSSENRDIKGKRQRICTEVSNGDSMLNVWEDNSKDNTIHACDTQADREYLLLERMRNKSKDIAIADYDERSEEETRNDKEGLFIKGKNICREKNPYEPTATGIAKTDGGGTRICSVAGKDIRSDRFSISQRENRYRDRRETPQPTKKSTDRRQERYTIGKVRVENISFLGQNGCKRNTVYCIEVEDTHNFFINGVLVHNCDFLRDADEWNGEGWRDGLKSFEVISWHGLSKWVSEHYNGLKEYVYAFDEIQKAKAGVSSAMGKAFLKITLNLSPLRWAGFTATPGDNWLHFYPYFTACGLVPNKTNFMRRFAQVQTFKGFPEIVGWMHEDVLKKWWAKISTTPDTSQMFRELPSETHKVVEFKKPKGYDKLKRTRTTEDGEFLDTTMGLCHALREISFTKEKRQWLEDFIGGLGTGCVIFYNYIEEGNEIEEIVHKARKEAKVWRIDGGHHGIPTSETIGKYDVVLCQWQSGSEALNLQFLNYWVSVTPTYSYMTSVQARGRIKRLGQTKPMFFYYLKCDGIESDVYKALSEKRDFSEENYMNNGKR